MNTICKQIEMLRRIHKLIKYKSTGNPKALSTKLGISERMLYHYLAFLKGQGAKIKFSRIRQTYYYEEEYCLVII